VYWLGSTFTYSSPYCWVQISFHLSMAGMARSVIGPIRRLETALWQKLVLLCIAFILCLGGLMIGVYVLAHFHSVAECSVRLGDCIWYA
jgi:hypothetical protein